MKKAVLLNAPVTGVIARLGHTDSLCLCDAGLPVPDGVERIDLAVAKTIPPLFDLFDAVVSEMCVERALVAEELKAQQPAYHDGLMARLAELGKAQDNEIAVDYLPHDAFKAKSGDCKAIVRSGECTPYANIILYSGVTF